MGVEYIYADHHPTTASREEAAELKSDCLAGWPKRLIEPMRDAVLTADLDQLLAKINDADAHDPRIAEGLRRLAEGFQYEKLLVLFHTGDANASGAA